MCVCVCVCVCVYVYTHTHWGGGNNISRTPTSKSLNQIFRYLQEKQHTNVTDNVVNVPQRFDLNAARDVNEEKTKNFEGKLSKLATKFKLRANLSRNYFMRHGLHMTN